MVYLCDQAGKYTMTEVCVLPCHLQQWPHAGPVCKSCLFAAPENCQGNLVVCMATSTLQSCTLSLSFLLLSAFTAIFGISMI